MHTPTHTRTHARTHAPMHTDKDEEKHAFFDCIGTTSMQNFPFIGFTCTFPSIYSDIAQL